VKHALSQSIHEPTRITPTSKSCLDLLFTNTPGYILEAEVKAPIFGSDHCKIIAKVDFMNMVERPVNRRVWKYHLTNTEALNLAIRNYDWDSILSIDDANIMATTFSNNLFEIFNSFIPHYDKVLKSNDGPWFHQRIKTAINKRDKLYKIYVKTNNIANHRHFKVQAEAINNLVLESKDSFRNNLCDSLDQQGPVSKSYWYLKN
jgi:hypothetical protein